MKIFRILIIVQAAYTFMTALWPIVDIKSFMLVSGHKTDVWLVKTVGALLIPISLTLASYLFLTTDRRPAIILGGTTAIAFATIDFYYALTDVIHDIYMVDGVIELAFLSLWVFIAADKKIKADKTSYRITE